VKNFVKLVTAHGEAIAGDVRRARAELLDRISPRNEFEFMVCDALGEISWNEAIEAINRHRVNA